MNNDIVDRGMQQEIKFDFFVLGATLAILGFAIQTFDVKGNYMYIWLYCFSLSLLFLSFLAGLFKQESFITYLKGVAWEKSGKQVPSKEIYKKRAMWGYQIQKFSLIVGLFAYAFFRLINYIIKT